MAKADYPSTASYIRSVVEDSGSPKEKAAALKAALGASAVDMLKEFGSIAELVKEEPAPQ